MGVSAYINIILNGICVGGMYGLMSSAFTFQVGSLRMVNFTYGACIMLSMYLTFFFIRMVNAPVILAALGVIVINFAIGWLMRKTLLKRIDEGMNILTTMGLQLVIMNLVLFFFTSYPRDLAVFEKRIYFTPKISVGIIQLACFVMAGVILVSFQLFLNKTWTGRAIRAVVQNRDVAGLMGINSERTLDLAFSLSFILIGVAGMMLMTMFTVEPNFGDYITLIGFVICITAGLNNLTGALHHRRAGRRPLGAHLRRARHRLPRSDALRPLCGSCCSCGPTGFSTNAKTPCATFRKEESQ